RRFRVSKFRGARRSGCARSWFSRAVPCAPCSRIQLIRDEVRVKTLLAAFILMACGASGAAQSATTHEPILGGPCEGCEWIFEGMPDSLTWSTRIAPAKEPGEPMRIDGVVRDKAGKPVGGIIVYAYHTNAQGKYPRDPDHPNVRHGLLRAWVRTGPDGHY